MIRAVPIERGDTPALRESEAQLRLVMENSPDTIVLQDAELRYVRALNPTEGETYEQYAGKTDLELLRDRAEAEALMALKRRVIAENRGCRQQVSLTRAQGKDHYEVTYEPWRDDAGRPIGVIGYARNVNERVGAEALIEAESRRKDEFLATLAHELGNPLAPIRTAAEILKAESLPAPKREAAREVIGGALVFPIDKARELLQRYAEYSVSAPDELYVDTFVAYPQGGRAACGFDVCYSGPARDADRVIAPLRKVGTPLVDRIAAVDYVALQRSGDSTDPRAQGNYTKTGFTTEIADGTIDAILRGLRENAAWSSSVYFQHAGGAIGRVDPAATAFPHRHAKQNLMLFSEWKASDDGTGPIAWAREFWKTLEPATRGIYVNEVEGNEGAKRLNANYLGNYPRLAGIKRQFDPTNLFRLNANITPA